MLIATARGVPIYFNLCGLGEIDRRVRSLVELDCGASLDEILPAELLGLSYYLQAAAGLIGLPAGAEIRSMLGSPFR